MRQAEWPVSCQLQSGRGRQHAESRAGVCGWWAAVCWRWGEQRPVTCGQWSAAGGACGGCERWAAASLLSHLSFEMPAASKCRSMHCCCHTSLLSRLPAITPCCCDALPIINPSTFTAYALLERCVRWAAVCANHTSQHAAPVTTTAKTATTLSQTLNAFSITLCNCHASTAPQLHHWRPPLATCMPTHPCPHSATLLFVHATLLPRHTIQLWFHNIQLVIHTTQVFVQTPRLLLLK